MMWYMLQDKDLYVYHYTRSETLARYILPTDKLRFSRFECVNDPREAKDWALGFHSIRTAIMDDTEAVSAAVNRIMKRRYRIGCFVTDVYEALVTPEREQRGEDIVGACYERGHSRPRMWAQYADNFRGACLVFDRTKLDEKVNVSAKAMGASASSGPIEYRNPRAVPNLQSPDPLVLSLDLIRRNGIDRAVQMHIDAHRHELFFLKATDWSQEREYRWAICTDDEQDFLVSFGEALVGVAIGDRFPDEHKAVVGEYCLERSIEVVEMAWLNGIPQPKPLAPRVLASGGYLTK